MGSLRTSPFTGDKVSEVTVQPLSHHTRTSHRERLTVCGQNPCPGPVWLNVSFVSGCLGFPPERRWLPFVILQTMDSNKHGNNKATISECVSLCVSRDRRFCFISPLRGRTEARWRPALWWARTWWAPGPVCPASRHTASASFCRRGNRGQPWPGRLNTQSTRMWPGRQVCNKVCLFFL